MLSHEILPSKKTSAISAPIGREGLNLIDNILYVVLISSAYLIHLVIFFTEELSKNTYNYKEVKTDGEFQIGPCDLSKDRRQACPSFPCIPIFLLWLLAVTYSCGSHRCGGRRGKRNLFSFCRSACSSHTVLPPAGFKLPGNGGGGMIAGGGGGLNSGAFTGNLTWTGLKNSFGSKSSSLSTWRVLFSACSK